jgi:hypothetical protein
MRALDEKSAASMGKEQEPLHEWDGEAKSDWDTGHLDIPGGGFGRGYSTISKRFVGVRTGDWGMPSGKKKASSLRNEGML